MSHIKEKCVCKNVCRLSISCDKPRCGYFHSPVFSSLSLRIKVNEALKGLEISHHTPSYDLPQGGSYCLFGDACFNKKCTFFHRYPYDVRIYIQVNIKDLITYAEKDYKAFKAKIGSSVSNKYHKVGDAMKKRIEDPTSLTDEELKLCEYGDKQAQKKLEKKRQSQLTE